MKAMTVRQGSSDDRIQVLERKLDLLEQKVDGGFRHIDQRFEQIDKRFEGIEAGLRSLHHLLVAFCIGMVGALATLFVAVA